VVLVLEAEVEEAELVLELLEDEELVVVEADVAEPDPGRH
jgi:hypothetical protein